MKVTRTTNGGYLAEEYSMDDLEVVEEIIIRRKLVPKKRSTDMDGDCFKDIHRRNEVCMFDNWDWKRNPVAMLSCPCSKCSVWM